ncbi:nitric oxide reductase domain protein [Mycobacterium xenopi 3993]|nr:nitric oxide reductase domain protein [Mycobacterium xenopi 3993]
MIFLDIILYSAGGVIGTMHHLYFSGTRWSTWRWARSSRPPK